MTVPSLQSFTKLSKLLSQYYDDTPITSGRKGIAGAKFRSSSCRNISFQYYNCTGVTRSYTYVRRVSMKHSQWCIAQHHNGNRVPDGTIRLHNSWLPRCNAWQVYIGITRHYASINMISARDPQPL